MSREIREIPPAPRRVRWGAAVWYRWPLGLLGALLAVYGGLLALMLFYARGGKPRDDALLDTGGAVMHATAEILDLEARDAQLDGAPADMIHYRFTTEARAVLDGHCFGRRGAFAVGQYHPVEYLAHRPEVNRLVGARLSLLGDWLTPMLGLVVLPGVLLSLLWLQGVLDLRRMVGLGDVAVAQVTEVQPVRRVVPAMLRVRYRFRDHSAHWREGSHWVRARSPLGQRLGRHCQQAIAVHDRVRPQYSRLVTAEDFAGGAAPYQPEGEAARHR